MFFLGIETSCDETSISLLEGNLEFLNSKNYSFFEKINSLKVISEVVSSQIKLHAQYGGVVPELAARQHTKNIHWVFEQCLRQIEVSKIDLYGNLENKNTPSDLLPATPLKKGNFSTSFSNQEIYYTNLNLFENPIYHHIFANLKAIFVTTSPGLPSALKVGFEFAKSLQFFLHQFSLASKVELIEVNHLKGHLYSAFFQPNSEPNNLKDDEVFPHLHLLVSGGNTQLFLLKNFKNIELLGQTLDDAVGETLDKAGRMLGLKYPAGGLIGQIASNLWQNYLNLPVGMQNEQLDFSYSGIKTAMRYLVQKQKFKDWKFEQQLTHEQIQKLIEIGREANKIMHQFSYKISNQKLKDELEKCLNQEITDYLFFIYQALVSLQTVIISQILSKVNLVLKKNSVVSIGVSGGVSASSILRQKINQLGAKKFFYPELKLTGDNATMIILAGAVENFF